MKVIVCENYDEMSAKAFEVMKELLDAKKDAVLGLATGSSPVGLYKEMIQYHKDGYSYKDNRNYLVNLLAAALSNTTTTSA